MYECWRVSGGMYWAVSAGDGMCTTLGIYKTL